MLGSSGTRLAPQPASGRAAAARPPSLVVAAPSGRCCKTPASARDIRLMVRIPSGCGAASPPQNRRIGTAGDAQSSAEMIASLTVTECPGPHAPVRWHPGKRAPRSSQPGSSPMSARPCAVGSPTGGLTKSYTGSVNPTRRRAIEATYSFDALADFLGADAKDRFTWSANRRHALGVDRSTGPRPLALVSRTSTRLPWSATSTQLPQSSE
jgi:hypothetical protein